MIFSNVSRFVIYEVLTGKLAYTKLCTRWVLKMLTTSRNVLLHYQNKGDELNDHIVMRAETWISYSNMKTKKPLIQCWYLSSPILKTFTRGYKFCDWETTVIANSYCETLENLYKTIDVVYCPGVFCFCMTMSDNIHLISQLMNSNNFYRKSFIQ